jgi:hypothetical protein
MTQPNSRPWFVQGRRGDGAWTNVPGEQYARREQATHRMNMFRALITDAQFRVVKIKDLPRESE